jgi:ribonuclease PH
MGGMVSQRRDGRGPAELRSVVLEPRYLELHPASCLTRFGRTWVLCTASVEERVPPFLEGTGRGWVTSEYRMMPGSVSGRIPTGRTGGRAEEISRLIGRSLRAAVDFDAIGSRTVTIDCQVVQADGGTRTASVTGGYVALALALHDLGSRGLLSAPPPLQQIAAISVGLVDGQALLDLAQEEDSRADADVNVVMNAHGQFVEIQGTAEGLPFERRRLDELLDLAVAGIDQIRAIQQAALDRATRT